MRTITNRYRREHACGVPLVRVDWGGITRPVHEGIADQLRSVIREWEERGGHDWYPIRQWWGYARRQCSGKSWHEVALAVDVNPRENPYVSKRDPCPSDMPQELIDSFRRRGFGWGGSWNSVCDAMHYSKGPNEGGDGRIYVEEEVEDMPSLEEIVRGVRGVLAEESTEEILRSATKKALAGDDGVLELWSGTSHGILREGEQGAVVTGTVVWISSSAEAEVEVWWTDRDNGARTEEDTVTVQGGFPVDSPDGGRIVCHVHVLRGGPVSVQAFNPAYG